MVLLLVDGLDAERFLWRLAAPEFASLGAGGAAGLMNAAVRKPMGTVGAYLTLGAGERLPDVQTAEPVLPPNAPWEGGTAAQVYGRRVGQPPAGAAALHLGWGEIVRGANATAGPQGVPGALASTLRKHSVSVRYLGPVGEMGRLTGLGVLTAADERGVVELAGPPVDPQSPALPAATGPELTVIDLPTTALDPEGSALTLASRLVKALRPERDLLLLVSPTPGTAPPWEQLCPLFVWGAAWGARTVTSTSTRTLGMVANIDVAPAVLAHLHIPAPEATGGHPARPVPGPGLDHLRAYAHQTRVNRRAYVGLMVLWGAYCMLAGALALAALLTERAARLAPLARAAVSGMAAVPLGMLVAGGFFFFSARNMAFFTALVAAGLASIALVLGRRGSPLWWVYLFTVIGVAADLFTGGERLALALLSDFPVTGMRFYGMGNEYLGVFLGCGLMLVPWAWQLRGRERLDAAGWLLAGLLWAVLIGGTAWPGLGADLGGALAALVGALATTRLCVAGRLRVRDAFWAVAGVVALGIALFWIDSLRPPEARSHLGDLARAARGDVGVLLPVVRRKAEMAIRLLFGGPFVGSLVAVAPLLWLWYHAGRERSLAVLRRQPLLAAGIGGTFVGAVAALLFNDSGVVPWGIMTGCVLAAWLDALLAERRPALPGATP